MEDDEVPAEAVIRIMRRAIGEENRYPATILRQRYSDDMKITPKVFLHQFGTDMSFGEFGEPLPRVDPHLRIVAATHFQRYEKEKMSDEDMIGIYTPIYRILCVIALVKAHLAKFEGYGEIKPETVLPLKPKRSFRDEPYVSLYEVACSVWTRVCHGYYEKRKTAMVMEEIICFYPDESRAHYVWLEIDMTSETWVKVRATTFTEDVKRTLLLFMGTVACRINLAHGIVSICEGEVDQGEGLAFMPNNNGGVGCVLRRGDNSMDYFLILTSNGGEYAGFYRNAGGILMTYPLWMHPTLTATPDDAHEDPEEMTEIPLTTRVRCACCGKADYRQEFTLPNGIKICSNACLETMKKIEASRDNEMVRGVGKRREEQTRRVFLVEGISSHSVSSDGKV